MILGDAQIGQMTEPVEFLKPPIHNLPPKKWALTGAEGRKRNIIKSFYPVKGELEAFNAKLQKKYQEIERSEVRYEGLNLEGADVVLIAYGTSARICKEVVKHSQFRNSKFEIRNMKVGLIRPITLWPFPKDIIHRTAERTSAILTVEMSAGQMVEDVRLAVEGRCPVYFYGRTGGGVPTSKEITEKLRAILQPTEESVNPPTSPFTKGGLRGISTTSWSCSSSGILNSPF